MTTEILLELAGGLGLFLFGMNLMSDGIEKAAGDKLRGILELFTKNKITGAIVGVIFTGIIQSSSACTVMVVSFVNAGLMNLYQAAGVIFGANIGTTVTSQLVSFNLSKVAPVFVLLGILVVMFVKKEMVTKIAGIILGFGVLFMGLSSMSAAMSGMKENPAVVQILGGLDSPVMAILLGTVVTAIIQSSSVTVSILLLMANQGLLGLEIVLYIILGCNIGACASAIIASLSGKKDAKRAAMIHLLFNIIGTVILYIILQIASAPVIGMIQSISGDNGRFVANAHTIIKIFQVVILLPFSNHIVKLTHILVPGEDKKVNYRESYTLKYIGDRTIFNPATAVVEAIKEMERMAELAGENINRSINALITLDEDTIEEVYEAEKNIDFLSHAITDYLVRINRTNLPIEDMKSIGALFHVVNDIERIGDHAENVAEAAKMSKQNGFAISKDAYGHLSEMVDMTNTIIRYAIQVFAHNKIEYVQAIIDLEDAIDKKERELQKYYVSRLTEGKCSPEAGMVYSDILTGLERVADHAVNIAFAIKESEPENDDE